MALKVPERKNCQGFHLAWEEDCVLPRDSSELSFPEFFPNVRFYTKVFSAGRRCVLPARSAMFFAVSWAQKLLYE